MKWIGYGLRVRMCVCVCACTCLYVCTHMCAPPPTAHQKDSKPLGCVGKVCPKPHLKRRQHLCYGLFLERPDHSLITNLSPGPVAREARPGAAGELVWRRLARIRLRKYFRNVNGMPEWRASEPRAGAENCSVAICWGPGSLMATASQEWCLIFFFFFFN